MSAAERRERLKEVYDQARSCIRCPQLAEGRTTVVFGSGHADADLMFVGEAPGANEDKQGVPFVGQAGKLLDQLLGEIGLTRADVFVVNTLKCRPPGNRDPLPGELESCQEYLEAQLRLIEPRVVCTLGNFATKLLRDDPMGITRLHGRVEVRTVLGVLRADFARLPELLALPAPEQPARAQPPEVEPEVTEARVEDAEAPTEEPEAPVDEAIPPSLREPEPAQLGLF
jgi:uracil-DNA glycosylase family 4